MIRWVVELKPLNGRERFSVRQTLWVFGIPVFVWIRRAP